LKKFYHLTVTYKPILVLSFLFFCVSSLKAQIYPDQNYVLRIDSLYQNIETNVGIKLSDDGKSLQLEDGLTDGYFITKPQNSRDPFDEGLPSWNGSAPDSNSGFRVQMRFPFNNNWSPWLTVGYWKTNILGAYSKPSYGGGYIDYDNAKLYSYQSSWQFKVIMKRTSLDVESPKISKLNFFVSDSRTTSSVDLTSIINDNPEAIFIPTTFVYQYSVDPNIGGDICSPTSVSMILKSYNITVDPRQFAIDNYDTNFGMFGIWPRAVQNASEYGLDGAVTRYRTWSDARQVLANGGRISMSIGQPLYAGHLLMLAGFTSDGRPIVHDPGKSYGYSYIYNKSDLSQAWFDKGGVAYTFYLANSTTDVVNNINNNLANDFELFQNYPNPFNPNTTISFSLKNSGLTRLSVYDILGREVQVLLNDELSAGNYKINFDGQNLSSGIYIYKLESGSFVQSKRMLLLK
jgi:hypothetical protein